MRNPSPSFLFLFLLLPLLITTTPNQSNSVLIIDIPQARNWTNSSTHIPIITTVDINLCPDQCLGHARSCIEGIEGYECFCLDGFFGERCEFFENYTQPEIPPTQCPNHCSGKGICRSQNWTCNCDIGYEGDDCSRLSPIGSCASENGCSGKGECVQHKTLSNVWKCVCEEGYTGDDCSQAIKVCDCRHGHCVVDATTKKLSCQCENGFSGDKCDVYDPFLDKCFVSYSYCSGQGICTSSPAATFCSCVDHYDTPNCAIATTPPCPSSCSGNGDCDDYTNLCTCSSGFTGDDCNTSFCTPTQEIPCSGMGLCVQNSSNYQCQCMNGYTGLQCEKKLLSYWALCPSMCSGNGYCAESSSGHVCLCEDGWSGADCSVNLASLNCCRSPNDGNQLECTNNGACKNCQCQCFPGFKGQYCDQSS